MKKKLSFQDIILTLQKYWSSQGCCILQPHDIEVGAGTFHPSTILHSLTEKEISVCYTQPSRRPTDGRYGLHPNRLTHYNQFQVLIKPSPDNIQELYLDSLKALGIDIKKHDIRFIEDDWESPTLGASGRGWEIWCNGMEITQFTYMQQIANIECKPAPVEIAYGLERLALYIQDLDHVMNIEWNNSTDKSKIKTYKDVYYESEKQFSEYYFLQNNIPILMKQFSNLENECKELISRNLPLPAYEICLKASHMFNLLDAKKLFSATERPIYISRVRKLAKISVEKWIEVNNV